MQEMSFKNTPGKALERYEEQGFFVEPDMFSPEECEQIIQASQRLPTALDGSFIPTMNVHKMDSVFLRAMSKPAVLSVMDRLVHGRSNGLHSQLFFMPPHRTGLGCHQDNYFVEAKADAFGSAWIALVDVTHENGGLYAYPGSHKEGKLPVKSADGIAGADKREVVYEETIVPDRYAKSDLSVRRGTVVFLHGYVAHGSYVNHSASNRYVLLNTYIRANEGYRRGETAQREEFELMRAWA